MDMIDNGKEREKCEKSVRLSSVVQLIPQKQATQVTQWSSQAHETIPVTRQGTSIRRIFTRLAADFPLFKKTSLGAEALSRATSIVPPPVHGKERFSAPAFKLRAFRTATSYRTDIIVLFSNAVRYESQALFTILYCLHERMGLLQTGDIDSFFVWFADFHDFFCHFIKLVNDVLLPALRDVIPFRHVTPPFFAEEGQRLNRIVAKTMSSRNHFAQRYPDPQEAASKLVRIYSSFAQPLLTYLFSLEMYCSNVYERFLNAPTALVISRSLASELRQISNFSRSLPILMRWLERRPHTANTWLAQHYDYMTVRLYRLWRRPTKHEQTLDYFRLVSNTYFPVGIHKS